MSRKIKIRLAVFISLVLMLMYYISLPSRLFNDPYSTVLKSKQGHLLSASIAKDGQWRFPKGDTVPRKFSDALITFEDKRFYSHPGIDPLSLARALKQNMSDGAVVSGGSTISMQVIRLSRKGKPRTVFQKMVELVLATRLELCYSKDEILGLYAAHAPFGGNVVGLEAACWRYFGRSPQEISWGEAALLAVLPNAPSLIHPGKNQRRLKEKRDRLLDKLVATGKIDAFTGSLAKDESIPEEPKQLPRYARHLLTSAMKEGLSERFIISTIDKSLQERTERILQDHYQRLSANQIHNAAVIVLDVATGNVLTYVGNTNESSGKYHNDDVDIIKSRRSTGSILKPFLFAAMLDEGKILQRTLMPDVPTIIDGFSPKNFSKEYDGAVAANKALIRSLNIPAVHMLRTYRYEKFHSLLKNIGMKTLDHGPDHYGLSLILGGAEGTLWDITGMYASMARTLNNFWKHPGQNRYDKHDFHPPFYVDRLSSRDTVSLDLEATSWISAAAVFQTFDALKEVYRPDEESGWKYFSSSKKIAWKTGTSFGFRDAWAVGVTPQYAVGVWVGNADGEGRPGLTGTDAAAPLMFDVFSQLKENSWFQAPKQEMERITICKQSGYRNSAHCNDMDTVFVTRQGLQSTACPYHKLVHVSSNRKFRVHNECESMDKITPMNWFILPPMQEYYFRMKNFSYKTLPPYRKDCESASQLISMDLIYPEPDSKIFIPRELNGTGGKIIFELAHRNPNTIVYWHLDGNFVGATKGSHNLVLHPPQGKHSLTLVDEHGETINSYFDIISYM
ncbi:MAG TPA: penicillin-binding protein 1C [Chryseolinea sp.]|nr:penicillin-binding protein 1C [Chryseolinea sp.]